MAKRVMLALSLPLENKAIFEVARDGPSPGEMIAGMHTVLSCLNHLTDILWFSSWNWHPSWASLVVQLLRIHLPMLGTQVQSLFWEDPTCCRAANPCAATTEPML